MTKYRDNFGGQLIFPSAALAMPKCRFVITTPTVMPLFPWLILWERFGFLFHHWQASFVDYMFRATTIYLLDIQIN
jgi:hypothetical protein